VARDIDVPFGHGERLWRRVEVGDIAGDRIKPGRLRLQISVVRGNHGTQASVPRDKWNGVFETLAHLAVEPSSGSLKIVCVDDPNDQEPGHALLAFVACPGSTVTPADVSAVRAMLSQRFTCIESPSKISKSRRPPA